MSANRNADLQRKLAAMPAPAPPDGLAQKIKSEIPKDLRVEARTSWRASLRIAASILVVSIGAYLMFRALPKRSEPLPVAAPAIRSAPVARMQEGKPAAVAPESNAVAAKRQMPEVGRQAANISPQTSDVSPQTSDVSPQRSEVRGQRSEVRHQEIARREEPAKVQATDVASEEAAKTEVAQSAPQAVALAAPVAAPSAGGVAMRAAAVVEESARLNVEATVSPFSGRTMVRVTAENAPEANVVVEGAEKIGIDLYAMKGQSATVRLQYRQGGGEKSIERTVGRLDVRPWSAASQSMKDAVTRAENPQ